MFKWVILVILISILGLWASLSHLPPGLLNDEADIGYEAYSILTTGKDQWGTFLPTQYFSGFGGTRLPLLVYWTVPFVKVFGLTVEGVRIAGVGAALLTLAGFFLVLKSLYGNRFAALGLTVLLVNPWFWGLTKTTNEAVLAMACIVWGIWLLLNFRQNRWSLICSGVLFGLSFYAYYSSQIFVLVFLALLFSIKLKTRILVIVIALIVALPLIFKTIQGQGSTTRLNQTSFLSNVAIIGELNVKRSDCELNAPDLWCRVIYNKPTVWAGEFVSNYLNHFSFNFLFNDNWFVGILPSGRLFYISLLPGMISGLYYFTKQRDKNRWLWISWLASSPVASSITGNGHSMRSLLMVPPLIVISVLGWRYLLSLVTNSIVKIAVAGLVVSIFIFESSRFISDYLWYFPQRNSQYSHYQYEPLFSNLLALEKSHPAIYISNGSGSVKQSAFYLFYSKYDPQQFQAGTNVDWETETGGWIWVKRIGTWHFVKTIGPIKQLQIGSLVVADPDETLATSKLRRENITGDAVIMLNPIQKIKYLSGDVAFVISEVNQKKLADVCQSLTNPVEFQNLCAIQ